MQNAINYVGVDISKLSFDVAIPNGAKYHHHKFDNNQAGFTAFLKAVSSESKVVMEASGPYYVKLASFLANKSIAVSVVNPLMIRRFCQMRMSRAKTDKKDACMIAAYGRAEKPTHWQRPKEHDIALQQRQALLSNLQKEYTAANNQLESFVSTGMVDKELEEMIKKDLNYKQSLMDQATLQIEELAKEHYSTLLQSLESIPGIGRKTAIMLIVVSGGFSRFSDYRKLISYIGLSPRIFESGTSVKGKARICKLGMSRIRASLYMCSWSAKRCNKA
jgi:transposase